MVRNETVYVTQPAETVYVTQPAQTVYVTQPAQTVYAAQPAQTSTVISEPAANSPYSLPVRATAPAPLDGSAPVVAAEQPAWEDKSDTVRRVETEATRCFCPCNCNGQRPCVCNYPCGSENALLDQEFNLGLAYTPYAEALNPETIWSSYAGLDRWDTSTETAPLGSPDVFASSPR